MLEITATTPTIAVMREYAAANNIDLGGATRRQDIADIIIAAEAGQNTPTGEETGAGGTNTQPDGENATAGENDAIDDETKTDETDDAEQDNDLEIEPALDRVLFVSRALMTGDDAAAVHARLVVDGRVGKYTPAALGFEWLG